MGHICSSVPSVLKNVTDFIVSDSHVCSEKPPHPRPRVLCLEVEEFVTSLSFLFLRCLFSKESYSHLLIKQVGLARCKGSPKQRQSDRFPSASQAVSTSVQTLDLHFPFLPETLGCLKPCSENLRVAHEQLFQSSYPSFPGGMRGFVPKYWGYKSAEGILGFRLHSAHVPVGSW